MSLGVQICCFLSVLILVLPQTHAVYTILIPPIHSEGQEAALIVAPGAEIAGEAYQALCVTIQKATSLKLWVAITSGFRQDTVDPISLEEAIYKAISDLQIAGMDKSAPIFLAAHSLAGIFSQLIVSADPGSFAGGLILWASYLTAQYEDLGAFPTPVYHVSGDLDGLTRMTRIGRAFRQLSDLIVTNPDAEFTKAVVIMKGINHAQFASGRMPPEVVENDIASDYSQAEAFSYIADSTLLFMESVFGDLVAKQRLHKAVVRTNETFIPLFMAEHFQAVGTSSGFAIFSQELVAAIPLELTDDFIITSTLYNDQTEFEESKPSLITDVDGKTVASTTSKITYPRNVIDNSLTEESAVEIATKMKNQLAVREVIGEGEYGTPLSCKEINQAVFSWALDTSSREAADRYDKKGRRMIFRDDNIAATGSQWVGSPLAYNYTSNGNLVVTSTSLYTAPQFPIPNIAGVYYCKQLSPYRAIEWIYVDSLRPYHEHDELF